MKCGLTAVARFTWPGKDESYICAWHLPKLKSVAYAMGLPLQTPALDFDEMSERTCLQEVAVGSDAPAVPK